MSENIVKSGVIQFGISDCQCREYSFYFLLSELQKITSQTSNKNLSFLYFRFVIVVILDSLFIPAPPGSYV